MRCGTGVDLDQAVARGEISQGDADAIKDFAAFLEKKGGGDRDTTDE